MSTPNWARNPLTHMVLAGAVLAALCGGWFLYRASTAGHNQPPAQNETVSAAPTPPARSDSDGSSGLPVSPEPRIAGTPAPATPLATYDVAMADSAPATTTPVVMGDDPPIDDIVKKNASDYATEKPKGETIALTPVAIRVSAAREPENVAAEIDRIVNAKLSAAKIPLSPLADDAEFLRRIYLDITGSIPSAAKTRAFLADTSADKRSRLIDELLNSHDYGDHFAHYWHELLVKRDPDTNGPIQTHDVYIKWLTRQFNQNRPWDQVVRSMLTAEGDQALAGETFFVLANCENGQPAPDKMVATAAALFLGNQLQCAECHVHPIVSTWKQTDFWGLAAFFGKTRAVRNGTAKMPTDILARIVEGAPANPKGKGAATGTLADGSIPIPDPRNEGKTIGSARAKLFGEGFTAVPAASVNRAFAADWFTAPKNPFFARAAVNRLWSVFMARGLINPLDDIRPDSRVSHLELLELLAEEFIVSRHDVKHLIKCICRSAAYQRSSHTTPQNKDDEELYSHAAIKVIPPRALFAALDMATNNQLRSPREDRGMNGKKGPPADGLGFFDTREYDESPTEYTNGVPQLLRLMNTLLPPACDAVAQTLPKLGSTDKAIEQLYLMTLNRYPNPTEVSRMTTFIGKQATPVKGYSAALWALLHTAEFMNNH